MKEVDIDELSETIRRFSYIENKKKKREFSPNHFIVAFVSMFSGEFKNLNKREVGPLVVKQRKIVDYIINEITNKAAMSASDKKAIKFCIEISFAGLSRNALNRAKTLAISQKTTVNQIIDANEKERKNSEAQMLEHECVAISVDSTTKDDIEIFCVMMRVVRGRKCVGLPLLFRQYKKETTADTLAVWLVHKLYKLGVLCCRVVNITTD
ncbi:Hypothetical protein EIN_125550, partial [Entamoeba invadens IP1]